MWYLHSLERYLALKTSEILAHVTTRRNLEDAVLSGISQSQKDEYWVPSFR